MLEALEACLGIVTDAAKVAGIDRGTHYNWLREDPEYKAAVESLNDIVLDFAESALHKRIKEGSDTATIFFLKTKGKGRGYVERTEITGADGAPIKTENMNLTRLTLDELRELERLAKLASDTKGDIKA